MDQANHALRRAREVRGWSQFVLARKVDTDVKNISRWERGEHQPSIYFCEKLCQVLAMDAHSLGLLAAPPTTLSALPALPTQLTQEAPIPTPVLDSACPQPLSPLLPLPEQTWLATKVLHLLAQHGTCTLYGLPGVGKTTLAHLIAHAPERESCYPDGVLWVNLGPTRQIRCELVRLATLLQVPESQRRHARTDEEWSQVLHHALGSRRLLLVLDDVWQVETALPFLVGNEQVAHLLTTRLPAVAFAIPYGTTQGVVELDEQHSRHLLLHQAPLLHTCSENALQRLIQACGGLPLALTLVGHALHRASAGGQHKRVEATLLRLLEPRQRLQVTVPSALLHTHPSPQASLSLAAQLDLSVSPLSSEVRHALWAFSLLPVKPESFSEAAALALSQQGPAVLDTLLDVGLLESASEGRYLLHRVIAEYGQLHVQAEIIEQRLVHYALAYSQQARMVQADWQAEQATLLRAVQISLQRGWFQEHVQLVLALSQQWHMQGEATLAEQSLSACLEIAQARADENASQTLQTYLNALREQAVQRDYATSDTEPYAKSWPAREEQICCPRCHHVTILSRYGHTHAGTQRYRCYACHHIFTAQKMA